MTELRDHREVRDVLRYWLSALEFEASLAGRPRAHRPGRAGEASRGQAYVRAGAEHAGFFISGKGEISMRLEGAVQAFQKHYLGAMRRGAQAGSAWVAGWPAVLFAQREELASLIRFPVELAWKRDALLISAGDDDPLEGATIDRELLVTTLGVPEEEVEALERRWGIGASAETIAVDLLKLLEGDADAELFEALVRAIAARLPPGVSVWPTGLIQDAALMHATYHLQEELAELLELSPRDLSRRTVLWTYLTGRSAHGGWAPLLGRFRARGLTPGQRAAAELSLGSIFSAVQGPPGTGKTELILNLAAHALVERIDALASRREMGTEVLVVSSTNNRAVDNVIDPLAAEFPADRLPLALRTGSREVTASATAEALSRARTWLTGQDDENALAALQDSLAAFRRTREALREALGWDIMAASRAARIAELRQEEKLGSALEELARALKAMRKIVTSKGKKKLRRIEDRWEELVRALPALEDENGVLARALQLPPRAAPNRGRTFEAWQAALPAADDAVRAARQKQERATLGQLEAEPLPPPPDAAARARIEALAHQLYREALAARERWAIANRASLLAALEPAIEAAREQRSLRRFFAKTPAAETAIHRLYPVLGSTLLSLGNIFPASAGAIDRLIVDEAGQCHPAYAASGLLRAKSALLIGDVHQLQPVTRLSERDEARLRARAKLALTEDRLLPFRVHDRAGTSAQALADRAAKDRPTLTDHFRCRREIIAVSDALAGYGLTVHTAPPPADHAVVPLRAPLLFASIHGAQARARASWANAREARALIALLRELHGAGLAWSELAVITPFVGQAELLRAELARAGVPLERWSEGPLELSGSNLAIGTVHRFQGGERRIVLFSTVITEARTLPFVDERPNLLNVAVSRAREHLVVFGDEATLRAGRNTRLLVEHAEPLDPPEA